MRIPHVAAGAIALSILLILNGCCCSDIELQESTYDSNMLELDAAIEVANTKHAHHMKKERKRFKARYDDLPTDETERISKLRSLNDDIEKVLQAHEKRVEAKKAAASKKIDEAKGEWLRKHAGTWKGDEITLTITRSGDVSYKKESGSRSTSVNAPVTRTSDKDFEVGMFGVTTTFVINRGPRKKDGVWTMTVDGEKLTRQ